MSTWTHRCFPNFLGSFSTTGFQGQNFSPPLCSYKLNSVQQPHQWSSMATVFCSLIFSIPHISPSSSSFLHRSLTRPSTRISLAWFLARPRARSRKLNSSLSTRAEKTGAAEEDIVIVGAGIAGLATAVSLQRLGVRSLVLEQAESLRTGGTSLTLFKNGWRVLDAIGVADSLRSQFLEIQGMTVKSEDGRELRSFRFKDEDESQEVRAVERRILLETLADQLPSEAIRFSSKLTKIETSANGETQLELVDGTRLLAKIVIGCDGVRSLLARWMGFSEPQYVGHCAFRGLGFYANGQPFEHKVNYVYGRGLRAGYVPVSPTKVYWFVCFNSPSPGPKITDTSALKKQAEELVRDWPSELLTLIDLSPNETISKTPLVDRWLWPAFSPPASKGKVVLVGDAWHPMTPNLGQGACCALEDAVVLARKLVNAMNYGPADVEKSLRSYENERWVRVFPLTIRANLVGSLLQWENPVVCSVRNNVVIPKLVRLGPVLEHTNFDCEPLLETTF